MKSPAPQHRRLKRERYSWRKKGASHPGRRPQISYMIVATHPDVLTWLCGTRPCGNLLHMKIFKCHHIQNAHPKTHLNQNQCPFLC